MAGFDALVLSKVLGVQVSMAKIIHETFARGRRRYPGPPQFEGQGRPWRGLYRIRQDGRRALPTADVNRFNTADSGFPWRAALDASEILQSRVFSNGFKRLTSK